MTNLDIIKYLVLNNPTRLVDFLNKICYDAWDCGRLHRTCPITDWDEWLQADPKTTWNFNPRELEEWSKAINTELLCKEIDLNHMCNIDDNFNIIPQVIDEILLLEAIQETSKYPDSVYNSFREKMCSDCPIYLCGKCLASKMDIVECPEFYD